MSTIPEAAHTRGKGLLQYHTLITSSLFGLCRFYYDFDTGSELKFTEEDLSKIKKEMEKIIKAKLPLVREEVR